MPSEFIMPSLFQRSRPWETSSWLWRRSEIAEWKGLRTNEDWMFEIDTALRNNAITHIAEPLCIKDDHTGENTVDLVDSVKPEIHRNAVARYALSQLPSWKEMPLYRVIKHEVLRRVVYTSSKLMGIGETGKVYSNGVLLMPHAPGKALIILALSLSTFRSAYLKILYKRLLYQLYLSMA